MIEESVNRDLTAMLYGVVIGGTGGYASLHGREAAGKTGTTQDSHDAWFVGFTADYVAAAWVGNDDSSPTRGVTAALCRPISGATRCWPPNRACPPWVGQIAAAAAGNRSGRFGRVLGWARR